MMKLRKLFRSALCLLFVTTLSAKEVTLASYNIRHGQNMAGKLNLDGTLAVLKKMNADIIALQEVDKKCRRSENVDEAKYLGEKLGMGHAFGKFMNLQGGEYGLAILSKYPILETKVHQLPEGKEPRVALEIVVEPEKGQKVSFVCIHLDWTSDQKREAQIKTLLGKLKSLKHPIVLIGDFNAKPESSPMALFKADWYNVPKKGDHFTYPANKPTIEIDYFLLRGFATKNLACSVMNEPKASDHRPIIMMLELPKG